MSRGVVYMAWGDQALEQAERSIESLRKAAPRMPVLVVGDAETAKRLAGRRGVECVTPAVEPFDRGRQPGVQFLAGRVKPLLYGLSPWDETLYVDADSEFEASPAVGFELLGVWDFVLAETENRSLVDSIAGAEESKWTAEWLGTPHLLYHNSGMLFWRRGPAVERLFGLWAEEWGRFGGWDEQVALLRALLRSEALYLTLPYTWNCRERPAALLHHRFGTRAARAGAPGPAGRRGRLVEVAIGPGRYVRCRPDEVEKYRERYRKK